MILTISTAIKSILPLSNATPAFFSAAFPYPKAALSICSAVYPRLRNANKDLTLPTYRCVCFPCALKHLVANTKYTFANYWVAALVFVLVFILFFSSILIFHLKTFFAYCETNLGDY